MKRGLEEMICYHCGPVLMGIKPAGLISFRWDEHPNLNEHLNELNEQLNDRHLYFRSICHCEKRCMLLVYHNSLLTQRLGEPAIRGFLEELGYPVDQGIPAMVGQLERRVADACGFPHEAGLFLGYPLEDVRGFWENRGRNYKMSGYWKVYGNIDTAKRLFQEYTVCRDHLCRLAAEGFSLEQLIRAA